MPKKKALISDRNRCIGCRICEMVCSATKEGVFDPRVSRIRVIDVDGKSSKSYACVNCEGDPACVRACPSKALMKDPENNVIQIMQDKCDACGRCIEACPYGAIAMVMDEKKVIVCDLCPDWEEPRCVTFCPTGSLSYGNITPIPKKIAKKQINISLGCNNCGDCVSTCSSEILKVQEGWLAPTDPSKCQVCEHCATNCPIQAIKINRRSKILF